MALSNSLHRFTNRNRRSLTSYLFGLTFVASILTVSASAVLPCPVRPGRARYADSGEEVGERGQRGSGYTTVVEKRPRRWIEEKPPSSWSA